MDLLAVRLRCFSIWYTEQPVLYTKLQNSKLRLIFSTTRLTNKVIFLEMHRAKTIKTNDTVTLRQFHLFLENAKLPPRWKCSRKIYWSARFGCLRIEFFRFLYWFSTYIPPSLHIALPCSTYSPRRSTYSPRRSTYSPRRSTYSPRTGAICNYIAPVRGYM